MDIVAGTSFRIDPWATAIKMEYDKLFKVFGIKPLDERVLEKLGRALGTPHHLMTRGVVFGHRDFDVFLDAIIKGERVAVVTGFMPSGRFHFGHKMLVDQLIYYQRRGLALFIVLADAEAYAVRRLERREIIRIALEEYVANMVALGLERKGLHMYFQTNYDPAYYRLIQMLSRKVTMAEMGAIYGELEPSKVMAALTQAADILHPQLDCFGGYKYVVVPVGADQDPHIRFTRDLADRFERELGLVRPAATYHKLMMGLDGNKMSSSRPQYTIFLTDDPDEASRKLLRALTGGRPTVREQRMYGGVPERCAVYEMLAYHLAYSDEELRKVYDGCKSGSLLCGECKQMACERLVKFLDQHRRRLERAKERVLEFVEPPRF